MLIDYKTHTFIESFYYFLNNSFSFAPAAYFVKFLWSLLFIDILNSDHGFFADYAILYTCIYLLSYLYLYLYIHNLFHRLFYDVTVLFHIPLSEGGENDQDNHIKM